MVKIYAVVLVLAITVLLAWIGTHVLAQGGERDRFDPEERFGIPGRRVVAGAMGFSLAGMSAEFSPRDLSWPVALMLAIIGGAVMAWYSGRAVFNGEPDEVETSTAVPSSD